MINNGSPIFIGHILENIDKIESFSENMSIEDLIKDDLKQYAIVRAIEIIGEAAKNMSNDLKDKYPEVKWKEIIGARDKMIHQYFGVNLEIVWDIIKNDFPVLKQQMLKIKKSMHHHTLKCVV